MGDRKAPSPPPSDPDYAGPPQVKPAPPPAPPQKPAAVDLSYLAKATPADVELDASYEALYQALVVYRTAQARFERAMLKPKPRRRRMSTTFVEQTGDGDWLVWTSLGNTTSPTDPEEAESIVIGYGATREDAIAMAIEDLREQITALSKPGEDVP